jgi:hypothetical protein
LVIKVIIVFVCLSSIHGKHLQQWFQTRGPQNAFVRPENIQKIDKIINFDQI